VYSALISAYKVPKERLQLQWTGENAPLVNTEHAELQNRVVDIIVR
jgi:outer membrane protein OmpA-like peptidoglycan-associated protein